jgi:hypothetical protein
MNLDNIDQIMQKPLIEKLQDMQKALEEVIDSIYQNSLICADMCDMVEYARTNGQIWGLTFAKGMLEAILREETRILCDKEKNRIQR